MTGDSQVAVLFVPPPALRVDRSSALPPRFHDRYRAVIEAELSRYPTSLRASLPQVLLVDELRIDGTAVRARYLSDLHLGVLTPQIDLRGNVHRVVAASLLQSNIEAAASFRAASALHQGSAHELYQGLWSGDDNLAAVVAALVGGRPALRVVAQRDAALSALIEAALGFLETVGFSRLDVQSLPPHPPYAFTSKVDGEYPAFTVEPGNCVLYLRPPDSGRFEGYTYKPLNAARKDAVVSGVERDIWILPETLLGDAVRAMYIVDDVAQRGCESIAGFKSGPISGSAELVVEANDRRQIFYHELGHAIHGRFAEYFDTTTWMSLLPTGVNYFGSAREFINNGTWLPSYSRELTDRGFLTSYASATLEEDVAELCEALFSGDARLWATLPDAPMVDAKLQYLLTFLHNVDPMFTTDYFERLAAERHVQEALWGKR